MHCQHCHKKKAKRKCPCVQAICPECCARARGVELDCPRDCPYFVQGKKSEALHHLKDRNKIVDAYIELGHRKGPQPLSCIETIEEGLLCYYHHNEMKFISDESLVEAIEILEKEISPITSEGTNNDLVMHLQDHFKELEKKNIPLETQKMVLQFLKGLIPGSSFMKGLVGEEEKAREEHHHHHHHGHDHDHDHDHDDDGDYDENDYYLVEDEEGEDNRG